MKKFLVVLSAITLIFTCCLPTVTLAETSLNLASMTQSELLSLKNDIEPRLITTDPEAVLYDANGIYVAWYGVEDKEHGREHRYQLDLLVSNQSDSVFFLNFEPIVINGFMISTSNALALEIPPHTSTFTASTNRWIFDSETLDSIRFNGTFKTITVHIACYPPDEDGDCSYTDPIAKFAANVVLN